MVGVAFVLLLTVLADDEAFETSPPSQSHFKLINAVIDVTSAIRFGQPNRFRLQVMSNSEADIRATVHDALQPHRDKDVRVLEYMGSGKDSPWTGQGSWWVVELRAGHVGVTVYEGEGGGPVRWALAWHRHRHVRPDAMAIAVRR